MNIKALFFTLIFIVLYTYVGYGIILYIIVKLKNLFIKKSVKQIKHITDNFPEVTLFITAYNEEKVVDMKMRNCHDISYPKDKLKILWVTDGSNDATNEKLSNYTDAKVLFSKERKGKTAAMNRGMSYVKSPIVVFTDANTLLNKDSIREIVNCFNEKEVGCVAGEKRIKEKDVNNASGGGEGIYWKYESSLKELDSQLYSTMGAAGELYGIRRELYETIPEDTLLDDFLLSMKIIIKGYKIKYCKEAYAIENGSANMKEEKKRKIRIAAGGMQSILHLKELLNIFHYGIVTFQYVSHRALRWSITPICLFLIFPLNLYILYTNQYNIIYWIILIIQVIFYLMAFIGYYLSERSIKNRVLYIPYYFTFMNLNVIKGFYYLLRKDKNDGTWEKAKRA